MKDRKSDGSLGDETEKRVVFIDLLFMITLLLDLSALKVIPAHFRPIAQQESKFFVPQTVEEIIFRSSIKALIGGNKMLFRWNCGVVATKEYSKFMFIPAKKKYYRQSATSKNSALVPKLTAGCLLGKRFAEYPRVVRFNQVDPFWRNTVPMECKIISLCWMDP